MTRVGAFAAAIAASMRAPRSPSPWCASSIPRSERNRAKTGSLPSGVAQIVTGPVCAEHAVLAARSISRACNEAAPVAPSVGMSRVLAKPGIGALASTAMATGSVITVSLGEPFWIGAEEIGNPQAPHEENGS